MAVPCSYIAAMFYVTRKCEYAYYSFDQCMEKRGKKERELQSEALCLFIRLPPTAPPPPPPPPLSAMAAPLYVLQESPSLDEYLDSSTSASSSSCCPEPGGRRRKEGRKEGGVPYEVGFEKKIREGCCLIFCCGLLWWRQSLGFGVKKNSWDLWHLVSHWTNCLEPEEDQHQHQGSSVEQDPSFGSETGETFFLKKPKI